MKNFFLCIRRTCLPEHPSARLMSSSFWIQNTESRIIIGVT